MYAINIVLTKTLIGKLLLKKQAFKFL